MLNLIGQRLGQYEILARFGEGGMATVYRARQLNIKREVAVKVILPNLAEREDFARRFEHEAQLIASLSNPHIVKVFDYGVMRGFHMRLMDAQVDPRKDLYYLVMELLTGGSLSERLRKGPLPLETISQILSQMALALDYAHGRGLVHRDLKPPNVLFDDQGNVFLTDFGIAKLLSDTTALTQEGMTMGTPSYMAPEQWESENLGPWTDLYALGVVLFEMLTGKLPFVAGTPFRVMHMHLYDSPPSLYTPAPNLPPGLDLIIQQALAKDPKDRFPKAIAMAEAFRDILLKHGYALSISDTSIPIMKAAERPATQDQTPTQAQGAAWRADLGDAVPLTASQSRPRLSSRRWLLIGLVVLLVLIILILLIALLAGNPGGAAGASGLFERWSGPGRYGLHVFV